jgi:3-hydroxyisobutyrate dehydrogenase
MAVRRPCLARDFALEGETAMAETVGFIGLGTMGMPMATNLAKGGVALVLHDASPLARAEAAKLPGARLVGSAAEAAAQSRVLFTCLPNDDIVRRVYLAEGGVGAGAAAGLVTCDCSTVSPETTVAVNAALAAGGVSHMDTPMLGSKPQAVEGEIFFIVGGDRAQLARIEPYLGLMGKRHMYVGGPGMANRVKLIHNGLAAATSVAVAEALATCVRSGVDPATFYEVVRSGGGMAYGTYFERRAKRIFDGDFSPTFMLELMRKDAGLALDLARSVKVPAPILEETKRTYDEAVEAGWGREDFSAVTHVVERRIGRALSGGPAAG